MFYDLLRCTRVWRNWQTRKIQVLMTARTCRFDPCYPHQAKIKRTREKILSSFFQIGCRARIIRTLPGIIPARNAGKRYTMKIKKTLIALLTILTFAFGVFTLPGCSSETIVSSAKKHSVSVSSTEECIISVDKTKAEFAETVTVTLDLKTTDKYVEKVTYNGKEASKRSETVYDFLMGNDDVTVAVELKEYQQLLISPNGFATYLTGNPDKLAKNNGEVTLNVSLNGSYMTILYWEIKSTNQAVIPGSSIKSYGDAADDGAISAITQTASTSNVITALQIKIDTDKIASGKTFLLISLQNGNTPSQKANLVVPITVAEEIVTAKWSERLIFDVSDLPRDVQQCKFNVYVNDFDFVPGSDNKEFQKFEQISADSDGKVSINVEYVPGRRYYVAFWVINKDGSTTCYKLLDTVGSGSSSTGYNQLKNAMLTFISDGVTLNLTVTDEIIH